MALVGLGGVGVLAAVGRDLVVEVGLDPLRVDLNSSGFSTGVPMKAGSRTTAAWNEITVGIPSTTELSEGAAGPLEGLGAVPAGDDRLAISESKAPGIVSPSS